MPDLLVTIRGDASLAEAARLMLHTDIGSLLVVDEEGRLVGIITDADFSTKPAETPFSAFAAPQVLGRWIGPERVERIYQEARARKVEEVMSRPVVTVGEDDSVARVLELTFRHRIRHIPVVRAGKPVGIVSSRDLLQLLFAEVAT